MTIGILEAGRPPRTLQPQWGTYDTMIRAMLGAHRSYRTYDVQAGELPGDPGECEAYVISGSSAGVYDDVPWIAPLLRFLAAARGRSRMIGLCFGHQAMATAFGGEVIKSPKGWGLGLHRYEIVDPPPSMREPSGIAIPAFHQDQVVALPPGAKVTAASEFTPFAGIAYDERTISVQGHPEFSPAFSVALIEARRDVYGPLADPALLSFLQPNDCARAGEWLQDFLDGVFVPEPAAGH